MLKHPTLDKLEALRLFGMAQGLREQLAMTDGGGPHLRRAPGAARGPGDD